MNRTFYPSEGMADERAAASNASTADARDNLLAIAKHLDEADILLSASISYVSESKTLLENLKKYVCIVEANIRSSAECITESGTRLQSMRSELQSLFQSVFYQESGHHSRYEESERNAHSIQATSSVSEHVLDTIRKYAIDMSIDVNDYTVTCDEYGGVTFVILHPKNKPNDSFNQERDYVDNWTSNQNNILENCLGSSFTTGSTANRNLINIKNSGNISGITEGVEFRNRREVANQQTTGAFTESVIGKIVYSFKPTDTASEIHQRDNEDPLPVNKLRQRSFQKVNCEISPYIPVTVKDASSSNRPVQGKYSSIANLPGEPFISCGDFRTSDSCIQMSSVTDEHKSRNFTQTGSKLNEANSRTLTRFPSSEKTCLYERSGRQPNRSQSEGMHSSKRNSSSQMKKSEKEEKGNGNTNLFVTPMPQSEDFMRTSHNSHDIVQNKENELRSAFNQPWRDEEQSQEVLPYRLLNKQAEVRSLSLMDMGRARALENTNHLISKPEDLSLDPTKPSSGCLFEGNWIAASRDNLKRKENSNRGYPIHMPENWKNSSKTSKALSENESVSCFARRTSSSNETITSFTRQNRLRMSFTNPRKPKSKCSQAGKPMFSRKSAISLIDESVRNYNLDKKVENSLCDKGNNFDNVPTDKRFFPNATLETTKELNNHIGKNASKTATFEMVSDNISKTTVSSDTNMEYGPVTSRSIPSCTYKNGLTTASNHLQSFIKEEKPYSSYAKEIPRKRPLIFPSEIPEIKKAESRSLPVNEASNEESSSTYRYADFRKHRQEQLESTKAIRAAFSDNSSRKSSISSYLSCKDVFGLEDTRILAEKFSDSCLVSDSVTFDNIAESKYLNTSNGFDESDYRSKYEKATGINYASVSTENTKSENFHDVSSSFCSDSSRVVNHSRSSLSLRGSACQLPDPVFPLNLSRSEKLPGENPLVVNSTLPTWAPENIFEEIRHSSKTTCSDFSRSGSRTSTFPPAFPVRCSSTPTSYSSSSPENHPSITQNVLSFLK